MTVVITTVRTVADTADATITATITPATQITTEVDSATVTRATRRRRDEGTLRPEYSIDVKTISVPLKSHPTKAASPDFKHRRQNIPTPAELATLSPSCISSICSQIATGTVTSTIFLPTTTSVIATTRFANATTTLPTPSGSLTSTSTCKVIGREGLSLPTPITIAGDITSAPRDVDDDFFQLTLPFAIGAYDNYNTTIYLSNNGFISLGSGTYAFANSALPARSLPDVALAVFWNDLYIYTGQPNGIFYEISGPVGTRNVTFEWYTADIFNDAYFYHFSATFFEDRQGIVVYKYYEMASAGNRGTVGVQRKSKGSFVQFSYNQPLLLPGLVLTIDTTQGTLIEERIDYPLCVT